MFDDDDDAVRRFAAACRLGTGAALRAALYADAVAVCDSGGGAPAALGPVSGADDVAELVAALLCGQPDTEMTVEAVNGQAGLALWRGNRALAVVAVRTIDATVAALWIVLNPDKLRGWQRRKGPRAGALSEE
ncbi:hypothetical protein [Cryptosporangium aurantiacum]|uniref:RNA polymerase sigma-70 factor, ECF subfamily n=1 Tax=Cryptosporangium aurantiacum TaxID=134849 RepID=A0A1M7RMI6_9ACTN|nr:hypothetical protein [Cryptosporangium aurantiacum]SHN47390.1 hypothetical protein SAMN05443668_12336 [Cryptosporangium aurantiacum]